jgi:hypothetical protein
VWVIVVALLAVLVVLVMRPQNDHAEILRDWEDVLSPWGRNAYRELQERVEGQARMAEYAYQRAFNARAAGAPEEAVRLLEVGCRVVERTAPDMVALLCEMAVASRMAAAISPVEPLRPQTFRLSRLSALAMSAVLVHQLLFSTSERFRLRAYVLGRGIHLVTRLLLRSTRRIRAGEQGTEPEWDRIAAARADLRTLSTASLQTFQYLLTSLAAEQR